MKTNKIVVVALATMLGLGGFWSKVNAQDVTLPKPQKATAVGSLNKALQDRKSIRSFGTKTLTNQVLSDLLWAADGVNRPDGHRTVPSAMNKQDVTVYLGTKDGTFRYDAKANKLVKIGSGDLRKAVAGRNSFIETAPAVLAITSDTSLFGGNLAVSGIDVGTVVQNVYLYCAANGLATVCCYAGDKTNDVQKFLGIKTENRPFVYMPVGYPL